MRLLSFILLLFFSSASFSNSNNMQKNLRALFTSSSERNQLNKLRKQGKFDDKTLTKLTVRKPITVNMQGVVIRKNHSPIIFINNSNNLKSNYINSGIVVKPRASTNNNYIVPISVNQQIIKLKPGQQWRESDKIIKDSYHIKEKKLRANNVGSIKTSNPTINSKNETR